MNVTIMNEKQKNTDQCEVNYTSKTANVTSAVIGIHCHTFTDEQLLTFAPNKQ